MRSFQGAAQNLCAADGTFFFFPFSLFEMAALKRKRPWLMINSSSRSTSQWNAVIRYLSSKSFSIRPLIPSPEQFFSVTFSFILLSLLLRRTSSSVLRVLSDDTVSSVLAGAWFQSLLWRVLITPSLLLCCRSILTLSMFNLHFEHICRWFRLIYTSTYSLPACLSVRITERLLLIEKQVIWTLRCLVCS